MRRLGPSCSSANNFALAGSGAVGAYWSLADTNALADRYFQPIAGGTSGNDMYFAIAHYEFVDNEAMPDTIGNLLDCTVDSVCLSAAKMKYTGRTTIADLLLNAGKTFKVYAGGYAEAAAAGYGNCPNIASDCQYSKVTHPIAYQACRYDASDIPFAYYEQFADSSHIADYAQLAKDVANNALPDFAYVKALTTRNEHPNVSTISDGVTFVQGHDPDDRAVSVRELDAHPRDVGRRRRLLRPHRAAAEHRYRRRERPVPYGRACRCSPSDRSRRRAPSRTSRWSTRRSCGSSSTTSSAPSGQLGYNDAKVHNIGSLLDSNATGVSVPE